MHRDDAVEIVRRKNGSRKAYCLPCKKRRVKCDEAKPVCIRCQRNTRKHECFYEGNETSVSRRSSLPEVALSVDDTFKIQANLLFETVFHVDWLPSSILLIRSPEWTSSIVEAQSSSPELAAAVCAIGALRVAHDEGSALHYQRALTTLIKKLDQPDESCYTTEVCVTIILLVCYEMLSGKVNQSYSKHLDGIAAILRHQVRYISSHPLKSTPSKLALLLYRSLRNIETTEASLQQKRPRLSHGEWSVLLSSVVHESEEEFERDIALSMMNLCAELTAKGTIIDEVAIRGLLVTVNKNIDQISYISTMQPIPSQDAHFRRLITCGTHNPFLTDLTIEDPEYDNRGFKMCIAAKLLTVKLQLQLHLPEIQDIELITQSETLVKLVHSMVAAAETLGGHFTGWAWCVFALFNVQRAFHTAKIYDERERWATVLLDLSVKFLHS